MPEKKTFTGTECTGFEPSSFKLQEAFATFTNFTSLYLKLNCVKKYFNLFLYFEVETSHESGCVMIELQQFLASGFMTFATVTSLTICAGKSALNAYCFLSMPSQL